MRFVDKQAGGCWMWIGTKKISKWNYGFFTLRKGVMVRAHRLAYELFKGPIPSGMLVCHKCDNPPCVNPEHLFADTQQGNISDMVGKGRQRPSRSGLGKFGESHPASKLTNDQVKEIREIYATGKWFQKELAKRYNVTQGTVHNIVTGAHYPDPAFVPVVFRGKNESYRRHRL